MVHNSSIVKYKLIQIQRNLCSQSPEGTQEGNQCWCRAVLPTDPTRLDLFSVAIMEYLRLCKEKAFILAYTYGWWEIEDLARTLCHMVESQKVQWAHSTRDKPVRSCGN